MARSGSPGGSQAGTQALDAPLQVRVLLLRRRGALELLELLA